MPAQRILVVEGEERVRALVAAVLRADGHTVDAAGDRAQALELIDKHAYAAVLSDLRMPRLGGPELYRALQERRPRAVPALIFLTKPAFAPDLAGFLMESAAPVLTLPATPADISRTVTRALAVA